MYGWKATELVLNGSGAPEQFTVKAVHPERNVKEVTDWSSEFRKSTCGPFAESASAMAAVRVIGLMAMPCAVCEIPISRFGLLKKAKLLELPVVLSFTVELKAYVNMLVLLTL